MKAVVVLLMAIALASVAAFGQGQFLFNTHDASAGNILAVTIYGVPASGPDFFLEVSAGPDTSHLEKLTPLLALDRPLGAGAGYPNPFSWIYTVPGMSAGQTAIVAAEAFWGTSSSMATDRGLISGIEILGSVVLIEPPTPPTEVFIGNHTLAISPIPEPSESALFLIGLTVIVFALVLGQIAASNEKFAEPTAGGNAGLGTPVCSRLPLARRPSAGSFAGIVVRMPKIATGRISGLHGMESHTVEGLYAWADKLDAQAKHPGNRDDPRWLERWARKLRHLAAQKEKARAHKASLRRK